MYIDGQGLRRVTYMNLPHGFLLKLVCSPPFMKGLGEYLLEKYQHDPEADIQNTDLAREIELFSETYKDGLIAVRREEAAGFKKITISEFKHSEMN